MKKMIIAAVSAVLALSVFAGCEMNTKFTDDDAIGKTGEITIDNVAKVSGGYWNTAGGKDDTEKALYFNCGSWASYEIELKEGFDFDNKKVTISIKADKKLTKPDTSTSYFKFAVKTSDTMVSEITSAKNEDGTDKVKFIDNPVDEILTEKYTEFTFNTSDMWVGYSKDGSTTVAYKPYITKLIINPQDSCEGKIFINSIKVEDIE